VITAHDIDRAVAAIGRAIDQVAGA
jgi:hypothetical protein